MRTLDGLDPSHAACAPALLARGGPPREPGEILDGRLRLGKLLGVGGMGTVYEAWNLVTDRPVAIKLLHPFLAVGEGLARFRREAEAAAYLHHESIVTVHEFGVAADGTAFIVMELLEGEDLRRKMRRGQMPVLDVVRIVRDVANGLAVAHREGIVHRDLKPENIFVCPTNNGMQAKILDFGIAKFASEERDTTTATGVALGTPHYMAPEQARGAKNVDRRVDLYAIGVILYEALGGRKPHRGPSYNAILFNILHTAPEPLRKMRPDLSGSICDVVERAMAYAPSDRFQSAEALAGALTPFVDDAADTGDANPIVASSPALGLAGSEETPAVAITGLFDLRAVPSRRRWRWLVPAAFLLALGFLQLLGGDERAPARPIRASVETAPLLPTPEKASPTSAPPSVTETKLPPRTPPRRGTRRPLVNLHVTRPQANGPTVIAPVRDIDRVNPYVVVPSAGGDDRVAR